MGLPSPESDRAFNEGADARHAGEPLSSCPYRASRDYNLWNKWREGWLDMDANFAARVRKRWSYEPLPPVGG